VLDALQQRHAERQRLAGAGAGLPDDVVPAQRDRQGELLNGKRVDDALGCEGIGYLGYDPEFVERSQGFQPPKCGVDARSRGAAAEATKRTGRAAPRRSGRVAARSRGRDQPSVKISR
jgi:hypothetical protein